jgi:hypothetical protein
MNLNAVGGLTNEEQVLESRMILALVSPVILPSDKTRTVVV